MVLKKLAEADATFSLADVKTLFGMLRPVVIAATVVCFDRKRPSRGYVVTSDKALLPRMVGGTVFQSETIVEGAWREFRDEIPGLVPFVDPSEIGFFTLANVFAAGTPDDAPFAWKASKFFEGAPMPPELLAFLEGIKIPLYRGYDFIFYVPVDGDPPIGTWQSEEATSTAWMDFRNPTLAWYHNEVVAQWMLHVDSGFIYRPPLNMRFLRPGGLVPPA